MTAWSNERRSLHERGNERSSNGDWRVDALVGRLPPRVGGAVSYLLQPSSRYVRIPAGVALIAGGVLGFLPVLGLWMLPLGFVLLAEDIPGLRSARNRVLDWIERRRPHWLKASARETDPS